MSTKDDPPVGSSGSPGAADQPDAPAEPTDTGDAVQTVSGTIVVDSALAAPSEPSASGEPAPGDEPLLPATYDEGALRDAVGARPRKPGRTRRDGDGGGDDSDAPGRSPRRIALVVAIAALALGTLIVVFALLGRVNAQRYKLTCTTTQAIVEQGRTFPPWGTRKLGGSEWTPVELPPDAQCKELETDDRRSLEAQFLELLLERTSATLARGDVLDIPPVGNVHPLDQVSAQLEQALLLSRSPDRGDQRKQIERMRGDIQYWRASARLREASAALVDSARQFEAAAEQRPLHVSDAAAWAKLVRELTERLHAGPGGAPAVATPTVDPLPSEPTAAPLGTVLPVEPEPDAPPPEGEPPAMTPDAGVPAGGVLL